MVSFQFTVGHRSTAECQCMVVCLTTQGFLFFSWCASTLYTLTGPLFAFDVHDDVRLINDASIERDEVYREGSLKL